MSSNSYEAAASEKVLAQQLKMIKASRQVNRRKFLAGVGLAGAAAASASVLSGCSDSGNVTTTTLAAGPTQSDVLNFALNLEYLEATFYSYVTTGADLPASLTGNGPAPTGGGARITFQSQIITDVINEIAFDEISHVSDVRTLLSSAAVIRPQLNLAAQGPVTATNVLGLARAFEDNGVTAYAGSAVSLTGANLTAAAQILAVEGFHAGVLRYLYIMTGSAGTPVLDALDVKVADPGTAALAAAGPTQATGGFFATAGTANANAALGFYPGFAYTRTTSQVLAIVYGNSTAGTSSGGFFPAGVNGIIKTV